MSNPDLSPMLRPRPALRTSDKTSLFWPLALTVLAVFVVGAGVWMRTAPLMGLRDIRDAIVAGDTEELDRRIDFVALRSNFKNQVNAEFLANATSRGSRYEQSGAALALMLADPFIDKVVTAEGVVALTQNMQPTDKLRRVIEQGEDDGLNGKVRVDLDGLSRARLFLTVNDHPKPIILVMERTGLTWRLVNIRA